MEVYLELNTGNEISIFEIIKINNSGKIIVSRFKITGENEQKSYVNGYVFDSFDIFSSFLELYFEEIEDELLEISVNLQDPETEEIFFSTFDRYTTTPCTTIKRIDDLLKLSSCISKYNRLDIKDICKSFIDNKDIPLYLRK